MIASPTNFSTVPPWREASSRMADENSPRIPRTDSGSIRLARDVDPTMSAKTTLMIRRSVVSAPARDAPQVRQ